MKIVNSRLHRRRKKPIHFVDVLPEGKSQPHFGETPLDVAGVVVLRDHSAAQCGRDHPHQVTATKFGRVDRRHVLDASKRSAPNHADRRRFHLRQRMQFRGP